MTSLKWLLGFSNQTEVYHESGRARYSNSVELFQSDSGIAPARKALGVRP